MSIFFRFGGRLNRQPFLILCFALPGIYFVSAMFLMILFSIFVGGLFDISGSVPSLNSTNTVVGIVASFGSLLMILALFISTLSLCVRRLHDRDKSGWWLLFYYLASFILSAIGYYLVSNDNLPIYFIIVAIQLALSLWFFIELCFLRGTNGPNLYGSDPLTGSAGDASIFG